MISFDILLNNKIRAMFIFMLTVLLHIAGKALTTGLFLSTKILTITIESVYSTLKVKPGLSWD